MSPEDQAIALFRERFGSDPTTVVQAPGRVNLVGGHTDYNNGFVLPMAIDRRTVIAARPRTDTSVVAWSEGFPEASFDLRSLERGAGWSEYLMGVAWAMGADTLPGWDGVVTSTIPVGASLSSSAALELATALTFSTIAGEGWDAVEAAQLAHTAEVGWVGVNSGIMDQLISACGREDHAMLLDCRDLTQQHILMPPGVRVVVLDTGTRRTLTTSNYNQRRDECDAAATAFGVETLRDLAVERLQQPPAGIGEIPLSRARHVVEENARTLTAATAMSTGDTTLLGKMISKSHVSLRDNFNVSSDALNAMAGAATASPGCLGARMTGAGFAGCAIALVEEAALDEFITETTRRYRESTDQEPSVYVCAAAGGASAVMM